MIWMQKIQCAQRIDEADILVNGTLLGMKPKEDTTVITDTTMFTKD